MAAPVISWRKLTSSTTISTISAITLGTVTAGQWSTCRCLAVNVATNGVQNLRFWMNDSTAEVGGTTVSLGASGHKWGVRARAIDTPTATPAYFANDGGDFSVGESLATNFTTSPNNSVGAGISMGRGGSLSVGAGSLSRYVFLSVQPDASAYDGEHTGFSFQVGYDFS